MSLNLAPYHAAMRIGQGFNSYTHQICMNDAVVYDSEKPGGDHYQGDPKQVSQIVTYCTRHVDRISQVTDAMNVSAALSIKSATFGGGLSGSYVDSDKFKESSINFFVQVQVVNQTIMAEDVTKFNPLPTGMGKGSFTDIYGDCFISGFIEGGELDALISIKVTDTTTVKDIKAALEANFGKGGVGGELKAAFGKDVEKSLSDSETTITVNWNGGGDIKPPEVVWSIESLTKVAAAFPNNVARCPQRTYAILTKYDQLRSWQEQAAKVSVLDYDMAAFYTNDLLDAMMAYKNIWKSIHLDAVALEFGQITLEVAQLNNNDGGKKGSGSRDLDKKNGSRHYLEDIIQAARDNAGADIDAVVNMAALFHSANANGGHGSARDFEYPDNAGVPYEANEHGLDKARRDCRLEMLKIAQEVDQIEANPKLALDPDRDAKYMNPTAFRRLLPKAKKVPTNTVPSPATPATGPSGPYQMYSAPHELPKLIKQWYEKVNKADKAARWSMTAWVGDHSDHVPSDLPVQDYDLIEADQLVTKVEVWRKKNPAPNEDHLVAYRLTYDNGKTIFRHHSTTSGEDKEPSIGEQVQEWDVPKGDRITSVQLVAGKYVYASKVLAYMKFTTEKGVTMVLGHQDAKEQEQLYTDAPQKGYSFKGFWAEHGAGFDRTGVFYARDK